PSIVERGGRARPNAPVGPRTAVRRCRQQLLEPPLAGDALCAGSDAPPSCLTIDATGAGRRTRTYVIHPRRTTWAPAGMVTPLGPPPMALPEAIVDAEQQIPVVSDGAVLKFSLR